jgi:hypothetical protein
MRAYLSVLVLIVTSFAFVSRSEGVQRRRLTLHSAERAIDLAWQAELAGDAKGAQVELSNLVATSTLAEESAATERLKAWLVTIDRREAAFAASGKSARAYHDAYLTLKDFGLKRSNLLFDHAMNDLPMLRAIMTSSSSVRLGVGTLPPGVDPAFVQKTLTSVLTKNTLNVVTGRSRYEARVDVEAGDVEKLARGARVTGSVAIVLRDLSRAGREKGIASIAKHRSEARDTEAKARQMAVRRALDDSGEALVFQIRVHVLSGLDATVSPRL